MTYSDTMMMELGITLSTNIHNTRSLIRTLKYVLDILQTEEAFTDEEYKHTHTQTHTHTNTHTHTHAHTHQQQIRKSYYVTIISNEFTYRKILFRFQK